MGVRIGSGKDWAANRSWNEQNAPSQVNNFSPDVLAQTGGVQPSRPALPPAPNMLGEGFGGSWGEQATAAAGWDRLGPAVRVPMADEPTTDTGTQTLSQLAAPTYTAPTLQMPGAYVAPIRQATPAAPGSFTAPTRQATPAAPGSFTAPTRQAATAAPVRTDRTHFAGTAGPVDYGAADQFSGPTAETLTTDPGYQFRLQQGLQALENSAAAQGTVRTGGAQKGLIDYAGASASQEFGNAYGRARDTFDANVSSRQGAYDRNSAANRDAYDRGFSTWGANEAGRDTQFGQDLTAWQANTDQANQGYDRDYQAAQDQYGAGFNAWQANADQANQGYDRDYQAAKDQYGAGFNAWQANTDQANQGYDRDMASSTAAYDRSVDAAMSTFASQFQGSQAELAPKMEAWRAQVAQDEAQRARQFQGTRDQRDDAYRTMVFKSDDNFRRNVYGNDEAYRRYRDSIDDDWKKAVMDEERERFLATMGAA